MQRIFKQSAPKKQRAHHLIEVFQKRNADAIKERLVEAGYDLLNGDAEPDEENNWVNESESTPAACAKRKKAKHMRLCTRVVSRMWEDASAEEVAAVQEQVEEEKKLMQEQEEKDKKTDKQEKEGGTSPPAQSPAERQE